MKIRKSTISILLCIALLLSLVPASAAIASEATTYIAAKKLEVTVKAVDKETGKEVAVENSLVTLTNGGSVLSSAYTDAKGVARFSLEGFGAEDLRNATVQACKGVASEKGLSASGRDPLFKYYAGDSANYYRYEYELRSETIDADGNWLGKELPISVDNRADIVFVIDGTGSMEDDLPHVKEEVEAFLNHLGDTDIDMRFSVIEYRDFNYGEKPVLHEQDGSHWFTDAKTVVDIISGIEADGGGDTPYEGLYDAINRPLLSDEMDYRNDALRFAFIFTDADTGAEIQGGSTFLDPEDDLVEKSIITSVITKEELKESSAYKDLYEKTGGEFMGIDWPGIYLNMLSVVMDHMWEETIEMELMLSEPRMYYNMSLCYLADDETSRSEEYLDAIKTILKKYSLLMAQATDGHVYLNNVIIFSTDSLMNFFDTSNIASMADIRMESTTDGSVSIHSNAHISGFYKGDTEAAYTSRIYGLEKADLDNLSSSQEYHRIQVGGHSYELGGSFLADPEMSSPALMHESGHYIFGFYDEYIDQNKNKWDREDKPYYKYGLMDNEWDDIELSKEYIDYGSGGSNTTYQHQKYGESCEDVLAELLEKGTTDLGSDVTQRDIDTLFVSPYKATYTKADKFGKDRRAEYPDAELSDDSFILLDDQLTGTESTHSAKGSSNPEPDFSGLDAEGSLGLFLKKAGDSEYSEIDYSVNEEGALNVELPVEEGEMAELLIATNNGGSVSYETYYVSVTEPTTGYLYSSPDNKIHAYATTNEDASYTFVAQNTSYENGEFTSLNQALELSTDGPEITGGEIYSVASCTADVDFSSISWFKYDGRRWTAIPTDCTMEENYNIGARADLDGEGVYVLMGRKAADSSAEKPDFLIWEASETRDAVVEMSFEDLNDNTKYYYVYYTEITEENFDNYGSDEDPDPENTFMRVYPQELCEHISDTERAFTLTLPERGHYYNVSVVAVLEDGSRSAVGSTLVQAGEADRDGDGIPDWYMNQYHLWPKDGTDISGNDMDGDGLTNLEEYLGGTDPIVPETVKSGTSLR